MTTPNLPIGTDPSQLPQGVTAPSHLGSALQDQSKAKFKSLAAGRFPSIVSATSAGDPASVDGPLGFVVDLFANFAKNVANADPATITNPEDLHGLITDFFEDLPVVGTLIDVREALEGTYTGDDPVLQAIQSLFAPVRAVIEVVTSGGDTIADIEGFFNGLSANFDDLRDAFEGDYTGSDPVLLAIQSFVTGKWSGLASVGDFIQGLVNAILQALRGIPVVGGSLADIVSDVGQLNTTAVTASSTASGTAAAVYNGWYGSGGTGDPAQVQATIEAVKDAVINGYTVETKTSSGTWTKPSGITELVVACCGSGATGGAGAKPTAGVGGVNGGYVVQALDPTAVSSSVSYIVGTAGSATSFGGYVTSAPGAGGISTNFGFTATSSVPGSGGNGGTGNANGSGTNGSSGSASALGAAGASGAGSGSSGSNGGAGGSVSAATITKSGGGGGGGGGGAGSAFGVTGGDGGAGGYPGGGGGGGGGSSATVGGGGGAGGAGAAGVLWIFYR